MISILSLVAVFFLLYGLMLGYCACRTDGNELAETMCQKIQGGSETLQVVYLPEDAVLRRHVMSLLRHEVEAGLPPRPTDSILRRHHETMVAAELAGKLADTERRKNG